MCGEGKQKVLAKKIENVVSEHYQLGEWEKAVINEYSELIDTFLKKNADYGNSFEKSCEKYGIVAAQVRIEDKVNRLLNLWAKKQQNVKDESWQDTAMDCANYLIMANVWQKKK